MGKGKDILDARKRAGLTRKQVLDLFGIPARTLEDWEMERRPIKRFEYESLLLRLHLYETGSYTGILFAYEKPIKAVDAEVLPSTKDSQKNLDAGALPSSESPTNPVDANTNSVDANIKHTKTTSKKALSNRERKEKKALMERLMKRFGRTEPRDELVSKLLELEEAERIANELRALERDFERELRKYFSFTASSLSLTRRNRASFTVFGGEATERGALLSTKHLTNDGSASGMPLRSFNFTADSVEEFRAALGLDNIPVLEDYI